MMFIVSINWTEQGIRNIKDWPKRAQAARDLGKKVGVDLKQVFLTTGEHDMVALVETANGDNMAKFAHGDGMVRATSAPRRRARGRKPNSSSCSANCRKRVIARFAVIAALRRARAPAPSR